MKDGSSVGHIGSRGTEYRNRAIHKGMAQGNIGNEGKARDVGANGEAVGQRGVWWAPGG